MITIRPATEDDAQVLWEWANESETRDMSFNSEPIPWEDHITWLRRKLSEAGTVLWIAEKPSGTAVGQVRYHLEGTDATVSISVDDRHRRRGICRQLLWVTSRILFTSKGVRTIHAYIVPENSRSVSAFQTAGYRLEKDTVFQGHTAVHMTLSPEVIGQIGITQPTYLPWIGYFDVIDQVDWFVLLDNAQFVRQSWHHRNRIKTPNGLQWLTVPVDFHDRFGKSIANVEIREAGFWKKHLRTLEINYRRAPFFQIYYPELEEIYGAGDHRLVELTTGILKWALRKLGIRTPVISASALDPQGHRSSALVDICKKVGTRSYLSMLGSAAYLLNDLYKFDEAGIEVSFHNYTHPEYRQLFPPFVPFAGMVDLLFNEGQAAIDIVRRGRGKPYTTADVPKENCTMAGEA